MDSGIQPAVPTTTAVATARGGLLRRACRRPSRRLVALALSAVLVGAGAGQAVAAHEASVERAAAAQAVLAERERQVRVADAATARLTAGAVQHAAARRTQALATARAAVQTAGAVVVRAEADLPTETVTPLDQATAALAALIGSAPSAAAVTTPFHPEALLDPRRTAAATRVPERADRTGTRVPPVTPAAVSSGTASDDAPPAMYPAATPTASVSPTSPVEPVGSGATTTVSAAAASSVPGAAPAPVPTTPAPATPATGPVAGTTAATDGAAPSTGPSAGPSAGPASTTGPAPTRGAGEVAVGQQQLAALDLGVSAEMEAAARRVVELSAQVLAAAEAAAAEAAAAAAAQAAAEEAARVAAEELARTVAAVDEAPNGDIPLDLLCGVDFADGVHLRCDAAQALELLNEAYRADHGVDLEVSSSYRSFEAQVAVKAAKGDLAATPGRSNHGRALAVDLGGFGAVGQFDDPDYRWMKEHAERFGWHHPAGMEPGGSGPLEPWHWEYDTEDPRQRPSR